MVCRALRSAPSGQQQLESLPIQASQRAVVGSDNCIGQFAFRCLQLQNFFFDGIPRNQTVCKNAAGLPNPVRAVDGLRFGRGIPPGVEEKDGGLDYRRDVFDRWRQGPNLGKMSCRRGL